jgi:hypothetical protein
VVAISFQNIVHPSHSGEGRDFCAMLRSRLHRPLVLATLLTQLAGCTDSSTKALLANGISSNIYTTSTKERADLLGEYFGLMCGRAGVSSRRTGEKSIACEDQELRPVDWQNVVRSSMNDVDERCDAYLETVDNARRDRDFYRKQLANTETTSLAILGLKGDSLKQITKESIAIVGVAFGFARNSLDNYYSRLILEVEKTSLRSLVKKRQTAYRNTLERNYMQYVVDRSAAYYAMRGYLRLCTPTSIEAEIKSTVVGLSYERDGKRGSSGTEKDPDLESLAALPR